MGRRWKTASRYEVPRERRVRTRADVIDEIFCIGGFFVLVVAVLIAFCVIWAI